MKDKLGQKGNQGRGVATSDHWHTRTHIEKKRFKRKNIENSFWTDKKWGRRIK